MINDKIIIALDVNTIKEEERLLDILSPHIRIFKVGMELFYSCGPKAIEIIRKHDREIFLDLKFCDIPNTVRSAARAITRLGVFMFNVHVAGGAEMIKGALEGLEEESQRLGIDRARILGVTVLTSMDNQTLQQVGINKSSAEQVLSLAMLARESGLDGVVASPQEAALLKREIGKDFLIVTPGVRPEGVATEDQKRTATPKEAFNAGADYIVIGRPVTKAKDPIKVLEGLT